MERNPSFDVHPSEEVLEEYCFNRLPETTTAELENHLFACAGCRDALQDLDEYILLMKLATAEHSAMLSPGSQAAANRGREQSRLGTSKRGLMANTIWAISSGLACVLGLVLLHTAPAQPASAVALSAFRGGENAAVPHAPAEAPLDLQADIADLPSADAYRIQVVDPAGRPVWDRTVAVSNGELSAHLPKGLRQGVYWVRLYSKSGQLLREFGLRLDDPSRHP